MSNKGNWSQKLLFDVRFVHEIKKNLLLVGMLDAAGFAIKIEHEKMRVSKGSLVVLKACK